MSLESSDISKVFLSRLVLTSNPQMSGGKIFKICVSICSISAFLGPVLRFFWKIFSKLLSLHYETLFFVVIFEKFIQLKKTFMAKDLWKLRSDLSWKYAASSTEGITRSNHYFDGNKAKEWISKRVFQENKMRQIFWKKNEHF